MKRMLIDATHLDETRVAIMDGTRLDDFEAETADKAQLKGNIYIGEVSRVEPSLQAAFITYGGNRNGFLAFGEVHPQFFNLPKKEQDELVEEITELAERRRGHLREDAPRDDEDEDAAAARKAAELADADDGAPLEDEKPSRGKKGDASKDAAKRQPGIYRRFRIQDVLKEGQKILVQVVKEERGSKGAALTTYFSMPGRYTVLMPNTPYAGGISRKITDGEERRHMRDMYAAMNIPNSMGLIIRTAGVSQPVDAVVRDYENMKGLWDKIIKDFKKQDEIQCVHEDGSLIVRAVRDMMRDDIEEVLIAGSRGYKTAKDLAKALAPEATKVIKEYKDSTPLFAAHKVEEKLNQLHFSRVQLPSGGYMIINPTEALVAIDINSGRATQERNIEETALKTNLEACDELGRQIRLRDLSGLIVVDFIDMEDGRNVRKVENAMRKVLRRDRARVQYSPISDFGLMEISRQRLRPSFEESHFVACPHCGGSGLLHAPSTAALMVLRRLEEEDCRDADRVVVTAAPELVLWILNNKRHLISDLEAKNKYHLVFKSDASLIAPDHKLELVVVKADGSETSKVVEVTLREQPELPPEERYKKGARRSRGGASRSGTPKRATKDEPTPTADEDDEADEKPRGRNRSRGGRRNASSSNERRPRRVGGDETKAEATDTKTSGDRPSRSNDKGGKGPARPRRVSDEKPAEAKEIRESKEVKKAAPKKAAPKAKDEPLKVEKVDVGSDDDTPAAKPAKRKKMAVKMQKDTDKADEPLKVEKVALDDAAPKGRKSLIGRMLG